MIVVCDCSSWDMWCCLKGTTPAFDSLTEVAIRRDYSSHLNGYVRTNHLIRRSYSEMDPKMNHADANDSLPKPCCRILIVFRLIGQEFRLCEKKCVATYPELTTPWNMSPFVNGKRKTSHLPQAVIKDWNLWI